MPKNKVKTEPVNKEVFLKVLRAKGSSIKKLDKEGTVTCSDKTIRRSLNSGSMRWIYIDQIARCLNVDPRLLTGEMLRGAFLATSKLEKNLYLSPLRHIDQYPYFRAEQDRLRKEEIGETIKRVLSLFEISMDQFNEMTFDKQYDFQHDLLNAILPVIYKHFNEDGYGDAEMVSCQRIIIELESYKEDYDLKEYANTVLRQRFIDNCPKGYTVKEISAMSPDELIDLDMSLDDEHE